MYLNLFEIVFFFFFKQKTAYEMRISDWSSDVCSSDLSPSEAGRGCTHPPGGTHPHSMEDRPRSSTRSAGRRRACSSSSPRLRRWNGGCHRRPDGPAARDQASRSDERRVGKEAVSTGRTRWSPCH